jgi:hypothetical protein
VSERREPDQVIRTIPDPPVTPDGVALHTIRILGAPVRVWDRAGTHTAELMREFALLKIGTEAGTTRQVPERLLDLVADLRARYAGASASQALELEDAVEGGERTHDFTYQVPDGIGEACERLSELLDEADAYCAQGTALMTLVSPPDQREFRAWYLGEFVRQSAGEPPRPWAGSTD